MICHLHRTTSAFPLLVCKSPGGSFLRPLLPFPSWFWARCYFCLWSFLRLVNIAISWWLVRLLILISLNISPSSSWKFMPVSGICPILCEHLGREVIRFFFLCLFLPLLWPLVPYVLKNILFVSTSYVILRSFCTFACLILYTLLVFLCNSWGPSLPDICASPNDLPSTDFLSPRVLCLPCLASYYHAFPIG